MVVPKGEGCATCGTREKGQISVPHRSCTSLPQGFFPRPWIESNELEDGKIRADGETWD
jgi:hypothetical protein